MTNIKASTENRKQKETGNVYSKVIENSNTQYQEFTTQPARISDSCHYLGMHCYFSRVLHIDTAGRELREQHNNPNVISFLWIFVNAKYVAKM
jgi:hypothetical protein